jgi:hypothetical protein
MIALGNTAIPTLAPSQILEPTATSTPWPIDPLASLYPMRIMSFIVNYGAGVDPNYQNLPGLMPADQVKGRIPILLKMIKIIQPDILGLQ